MASAKSIKKDENFYKRVLNRSTQRFLEDLDPVSVLDLFLEKDYLTYIQLRDIQEQGLTSDKIRGIIKKVSSKGVQGYKTFKTVLRESHQEHLAEFLERQESVLVKEIKMAEKEKERQIRAQETVVYLEKRNMRIPDDKELLSISAHIGMNWEMLGPFLGIPTPTVDQIKLDNSTTRQKIYRLLYVWRGVKGPDATVENLLSLMRMAPKAVNIAWDSVEETLKHYDSVERKVDHHPLGSATGARPKTIGVSQQPAYEEAEAVSRGMQQLNLGLPTGNVGDQKQGEQDRPASLMSERHSYPSGQFQTEQSNNPSLAAMQGELGKTQRSGELYSNQYYGPDLSGKSFFNENRLDEQPYIGASAGKTDQGIHADRQPYSVTAEGTNGQRTNANRQPEIGAQVGKTNQGTNADRQRHTPTQVRHTDQAINADGQSNMGTTAGSKAPGLNADIQPNIGAQVGNSGQNTHADAHPRIPTQARNTGQGINSDRQPHNETAGENTGQHKYAEGQPRTGTQLGTTGQGLKADRPHSLGAPVGNSGQGINAGEQLYIGGEVDETDAARRRSLEREINQNPPPPTFTFAKPVGSPATLSAAAAGPSVATYDNASQGNAQGISDAQNSASGGNVTVEHSQSDEDLKNSISTIKNEIVKVENFMVRGESRLPQQVISSMPGEDPGNNNLTERHPDYVDGSTEERDKRLKDIFDSEQDMKGRLKVLTDQNLRDLLGTCGNEPKHKGGYGDIYVSKGKIPGIDMRLVVKKIKCEKDEAKHKLRSLTNEKLCARAMHYAIVPLLAIREDPENRTFYFISPYMENGDLNHAIEKDTGLIREGKSPMLGVSHRLRIMFHIASAIDFLHTRVPEIRGLILHMDIKSLNIVLDQYLNARLIDFGLAREMKQGFDHTKTTSIQYPSTPGYDKDDKETRLQILAKHDDYRYFGVVMRELLTGKKPVEGVPEDKLMDQTVRKIKNKLMQMWKNQKVEPPVTNPLVELSEKCIKNEDMKSKELVKELKKYLMNTNTKRWESSNVVNNQSKKCHMCLEYKKVEEEVLSHSDCEGNMNVCVSCMRNSYCNPIICHSCDSVLTPTIGHGWAALLIAGNERKDTMAKSFMEDVEAVHKVIISKCPLVMGVRADHVQVVSPDSPGQHDNLLDKMEKSVTNLKKIDGIHTLLVYLSGHYKPEKGGFELSHIISEEGESETKFQYLSIKKLQDVIFTILNGSTSAKEESAVPKQAVSKRAIIFLDCCNAPAVTTPSTQKLPPGGNEQHPLQTASGDANCPEKPGWIGELSDFKLDPNIRICQINACRPDQFSIQEKGGSVFRRFLIQGLTRFALGGNCEIAHCDKCYLTGNFVTVGNLNDYISDHLDRYRKMYPCNSVMNVHNVSGMDAKIGYVINFKADLQFMYRFEEKRVASDKIPQRMFSELSELQTLLFDRYIEEMKLDVSENPKLNNADFNGILCVEVEKGPKKHQRDRLESLDRIMTAWNAKRELVVSLRTLSEIYQGMVGVFMPPDQTVQPILEFLSKSTHVTKEEKSHATICRTKLNDFDKLLDDVSEAQINSSMETFSEHLVELDDAMQKCEEKRRHVKELHIIFPCASSPGSRIHRDFLCYQLKREHELH